MAFDIQKEAAILRSMTVKQLQEKYVQVFGEQVRTGNRDFLVKRIAWRLQANSEGGLSERAQRRAAELAGSGLTNPFVGFRVLCAVFYARLA